MAYKKAIMGVFFKDKERAEKTTKEKNNLFKKPMFQVLEFNNGFIVVNKEQLK